MAESVMQERNQDLPITIGISSGERKKLSELLNHALSDTYVLYTKIQGVHWNVRGTMFYGIHKMTEEQYEDLAESIDKIAERIRALGFYAPTSLTQMLKLSKVQEITGHYNQQKMITLLVDDHQTVARTLRDAVEEAARVNDVFTADMLTDRIGKHEQYAWMLRALLAEEDKEIDSSYKQSH